MWPSTYVSILVCSRPRCDGVDGTDGGARDDEDDDDDDAAAAADDDELLDKFECKGE